MRRKNSLDDLQFERMPADRIGMHMRWRRFEKATTMHAQSFIVRRWSNLKEVRKPALIWLAVAGMLITVGWLQVKAQEPLYSHDDAADGGAYIEGSVGQVETVNPIFATNVAEHGLSELLFAGLLRVDAQGDIAGDLAESWEIKQDGRIYTIKLKPDIRWSDGTPITARDVVFTINAIQLPATRSPLASAWSNIDVEAKDERTIDFKLRVPYAPFLSTLTTGILPQHILSNVQPQQLRSAAFSTEPSVGSGPFLYRGTVDGRSNARSQVDVYLTQNESYHLGKTKLERFTMRIYEDNEDLVAAMRDREIMAASDIPHHSIEQFTNQDSLKITSLDPFSGVFAFFKNSTPPFNDVKVRKAFRLATDTKAIANMAGSTQPTQGPLLPGQLGYNPKQTQPVNNIEQAKKLLNDAGWKEGADGKRSKNKRPLTLRLVTLNSGEYGTVAQTLQEQWTQLGAEVEVDLVQQEDFQSNVITPHAYDVLVYELSIGRDSDVYAFWHSSQAEPGRLNLSEYSSAQADDALDSARTLSNMPLRNVKYQSFSKQWLEDAPAVALYRPSQYYVQLAKTQSVEEGEIGDALERFSNIRYWTADMERVDDTR